MIDSLSAATLGTKLIVLGVIVTFLLGLGFAGGLKWQAGEVDDAEDAQHKAEAQRDGWKNTANDLKAAAAAQSALTRKAAKDAKDAKERADKAVAKADKAADKFLTRLAELNRQAEADKVKCDAERARICGAVLR